MKPLIAYSMLKSYTVLVLFLQVGRKGSGIFQDLSYLMRVGTVGQPHEELKAEIGAQFASVRLWHGSSQQTILEYFEKNWLPRCGMCA